MVSVDLSVSEFEKALVILVPEAEPLVESFRERHDPSTRLGVPAHITINYPFLPGRVVSGETTQLLTKLFAKSAPLNLALVEIRRFPNVVYLAVEPAAPLLELTSSVVRLFPESLPYGGKFPEVVPHLTVAEVEDPAELDKAEGEFSRAVADHLPIRFRAEGVTLMDNRSGLWERRGWFRLASSMS